MTDSEKTLKETDFSYLAGIIDGEGTVTLCRNVTRRKGRVSISYGAVLAISNTNLLIIHSLRDRFGGNTVKPAAPSNKKWKQGYILYFRKGEILAILPNIMPYLTAKRLKAELLLEYMASSKRRLRTGPDGRFIGVPLSTRQKQIITEIRKNNRRGPRI